MIYSSFIQTKSNSQIPQLCNGKTIESKYNPEREAETLYLQLDKKYNFYIVAGIGSGIFINYLSSKNPDAKIIGIEADTDDIDFLSQLSTFQECLNNPNITICNIKELKSTLINNYLPAIYGDCKIIFQKNWATENLQLYETIKNILQDSIKEISADYSVQAHFGKTWQNNILSNLKLIESLNHKSDLKPDTSKTAAIIAAGPSLDSTINTIIENRDNFYIISTDTAYQSLQKYNITPEIVISIDGQPVSCNHFFNAASSKTNFVFDLCANSSITKKLFSFTPNIYFFSNGHPLSNLASELNCNMFPTIYTGSGTVTIAALDLALKSGFRTLKVFGADFGYINNKPYTKGTYLDALYNKASNHLQTSDKSFSKLMFRTELIKISEVKKTTEILESYKTSLENYLTTQNINFSLEKDIYNINSNKTKELDLHSGPFNFKALINQINQTNFAPLLPYIAWLRTQPELKNEAFENLVNLAYKDIVSYN